MSNSKAFTNISSVEYTIGQTRVVPDSRRYRNGFAAITSFQTYLLYFLKWFWSLLVIIEHMKKWMARGLIITVSGIMLQALGCGKENMLHDYGYMPYSGTAWLKDSKSIINLLDLQGIENTWNTKRDYCTSSTTILGNKNILPSFMLLKENSSTSVHQRSITCHPVRYWARNGANRWLASICRYVSKRKARAIPFRGPRHQTSQHVAPRFLVEAGRELINAFSGSISELVLKTFRRTGDSKTLAAGQTALFGIEGGKKTEKRSVDAGIYLLMTPQ